jgi:TPR repeat protein
LIAAKAGYDLAQHDVALWYYQHQKFDEALLWLERSAQQGSVSGLFGLSSLYQEGKIVPQDGVRAYTYFALGKAQSKRPLPKEAEARLDQLKWNLAPEQLQAAEDAIAAWKARPTPLTMKARSGIEAAKRLADSSGN